MNTVERVKSICKERKIPIYKLEKDLGFANGYVGQLKKGSFPDDRLAAISDYLNVSVPHLLGIGEEQEASILAYQIAAKKKKLPTLTGEKLEEAENDLLDLQYKYNAMKLDLFSGESQLSRENELSEKDANFLAYCHTLPPETIRAFLTMTKAPKELINGWDRETNPKDSDQ